MYTLLYIYNICDMFRLVLRHFHGDKYIYIYICIFSSIYVLEDGSV